MTTPTLSDGALALWLTEVSGPEWIWQVKYLAANDTNAKANVHQAGPHLAKGLLTAAFPGLSRRADTEKNPDVRLFAQVDSHVEEHDLRLVWYNSKRLEQRANGRDEARLTGWGGSDSAMLEADATGSLAVFGFHSGPNGDADRLRVWRCRSLLEEEYLLDRVGGVEPGRTRIFSPAGKDFGPDDTGSCALSDDEIPEDWRTAFPSGDELIAWVVARQRNASRPTDERLMSRRRCEFEVFRSIERVHSLAKIQQGFDTVDAFIEYAGSVTNRRKARSGRSLELNAKRIFDEEKVAYSWTPYTEGRKTPDFIFPSIERYHDGSWPIKRLRMLAAKTTCKDRWRQVLNEADRIPVKHLLTLQEGVSTAQHREMKDEGVQLVVPSGLVKSYPDEVRDGLMTFEQFVADARASCQTIGEL